MSVVSDLLNKLKGKENGEEPEKQDAEDHDHDTEEEKEVCQFC